MLSKCFALIAMGATLSGCAYGTVTSRVISSVSTGLDASKTHVVVPSDASQLEQPDFPATAEMTRWALRGAGLQVLSANEARNGDEQVVTVSFRTESTITSEHTRTVPIYSAPSSFTSRTVESVDSKGRKVTETTYDPPAGASYMNAAIRSSTTVEKVNKRGETVTETTYIPERTVIGYEEIPYTLSRKPLTLELKGYDAAVLTNSAGAAQPHWTMKVDMREGGEHSQTNLPYLLKAAQENLGLTATKFVFTPVNDPAVKFITTGGRKGKPAKPPE